MGVDDEEALEGATRGPVGIVDEPLGVEGVGEGPPICREGVWFHPPRPPRGAYPPRAGAT